ncbi:hypothetical protein EOD41_13945 [Mucilaginibacter limnophilus]|uniref:Nuclear transport factor 2 family protein n=1 Tax=Mucilaginibacter limnophilus TaxID=1932778 RepID=A0A437MR00_9SPHI|nr:nuclear transport factor 2 family protein [Mucilaginibacter limnophilus]RVU00058.1 hypothetical protein EOD41_13945 [Mucilaginibacter limnophilus]
MKTLKSLLLGLALIITANVVKANDKEELTQQHAIDTYIEAVTHGKLEGLSKVLDTDAKFTMMRGSKQLSFDKREMLEYLKATKSVQDCKVNTTTVENNGEVAIVKVDLEYEGFTRSNLVTITNTGNGWKITSVHSTFK